MANACIKVLVESHVPFIKGVIEPYAHVEYSDPEDFTSQRVKEFDALIIRTRTYCDENLLAGSNVKLILTATIGTDHCDKDYCKKAGINIINAPGCNAPAVAQYVFGAITALMNRPVEQHTIGIIGAGHVGRIVEQWARALDMKVLVCDPPRARREGDSAFSEMSEIARMCDIITFHTPLTHTGNDATFHLADSGFFNSLRRAPIVINSARGAVFDTGAIINALENGLVSHAVIDCWEGEPDISDCLLELATIATPHIAGYSLQGKARATQMCLNALSDYFSLPSMKAALPEDFPQLEIAETITVRGVGYNPYADTRALKSNPSGFEMLRNRYKLRCEPSTCHID